MFLLHLLPEALILWIVNLTLAAGTLMTLGGLFFVRFIPPLRLYKTPLTVAGVVLLVIGVYWKGGHSVEVIWRAKVAELEARVAVAEEQAKTVNVEIREKIVYKTQRVKEVEYKIKEVIKEKEKIINAECKVPQEAIDILNAAARGDKE